MAQPPNDLELVCADFNAALDLLRRLGMRLDVIYPADEPHSAILSRDGIRVRLTSRPDARPPSAGLPEFRPEFVVTQAGTASGEGRAGMHYRDLIPSRLGGRYIASHVTIAEGGPVADWVHFHRIAVQLICVRRGWVRVVYEDQGAPFVMAAGDMVLQPPGIRHRVLASAPGLEVVEITCPACHETFADHALALPNGDAGAAREYDGQRFLHHVAATSPWTPWHGAEAQVTAVRDAAGGRAEARIVRPGASPVIAVPPHDGELVFGFVLEGRVRLDYGETYPLGPADSFVIPPGAAWRMSEASDDLELLHVTTGRIPSRCLTR
ncbi:MAG TPA: cupin domain-containing protein [Allosphingosinicella sp.]|nr:cupin domain-containing protein [Allosphingosinicella sp.]